MFSEVHLKLPHSSSKKKIEHNMVLVYDPDVDRHSLKTIDDQTTRFKPITKKKHKESLELIATPP